MKYQLITYRNLNELFVENTNDKDVFDRFALAVLDGKFATLNEIQNDGSYSTIKLYHSKRNENKKQKP